MIHNSPAYDPDGYFCPSCHRPDDEPHGPPCVLEDHDLELIAAEMAERELPDTPDVATNRTLGTGLTFGAKTERLCSDE